MKAIQVTAKTTYKGRFENWTEEMTWAGVLKEERYCLHKSYKAIKAFQAGVTTCVYAPNAVEQILSKAVSSCDNLVIKDRYDAAEEFCYLVIIPAGTYVERFENEYRFQMSEAVKVFLVGKKTASVRVKDDSYESEVYGGVDKDIYDSSVFQAFNKTV